MQQHKVSPWLFIKSCKVLWLRRPSEGKNSYLRGAIWERNLSMSTAAPRLRLSFRTGIITTEDGPQLIPTFNPVEGSRHHTHTWAGASRVCASVRKVWGRRALHSRRRCVHRAAVRRAERSLPDVYKRCSRVRLQPLYSMKCERRPFCFVSYGLSVIVEGCTWRFYWFLPFGVFFQLLRKSAAEISHTQP